MMEQRYNLDSSPAIDTTWFYRDITAVESFEEAASGAGQVNLPPDWWVVVTDVIGSTKAIDEGRYKDVNTIGASTIMAILNVDRSIPIPYIFGGDGATLAVPHCMTDGVRSALLGSKEMARQAFGMDLRIALVPVSHLTARGVATSVGKFRRNSRSSQPSFSGAGWSTAENLVKEGEGLSKYDVIETTICKPLADFTGFECRWQPVEARRDHKLAILVKSLEHSSEQNSKIYLDLLQVIQEIYGDVKDMHPLYAGGMRLSVNPINFWSEVRVRTRDQSLFKRLGYIVTGSLLALFSIIAFRLKLNTKGFSWNGYRDELIENTDFRKFDGTMKMVVDGAHEQCRKLTQWLEDQERQGRLIYGLHQSSQAIVTCLVFSHTSEHTHFVDGSDGGYAMAAKQLKQKMLDGKAQSAGGAV